MGTKTDYSNEFTYDNREVYSVLLTDLESDTLYQFIISFIGIGEDSITYKFKTLPANNSDLKLAFVSNT